MTNDLLFPLSRAEAEALVRALQARLRYLHDVGALLTAGQREDEALLRELLGRLEAKLFTGAVGDVVYLPEEQTR